MKNTLQSTKKKKRKKPSNFAEALLEIGGSKISPLKKEVSTQQSEVEYLRKAAHRERHVEVTSTQVFNREEEEIQQKIAQIQQELKELAAELAQMSTDIDKAIHEETVNPGTYHVSFFEMIRRHLVQLKKKASESKNWLAISQQRKKGQNHFQSNTKKHGTAYMLSSEHSITRQAG